METKSEGGPETGLKKMDPMLRQLMVHHSVVNKFPKGFCIKIFLHKTFTDHCDHAGPIYELGLMPA